MSSKVRTMKRARMFKGMNAKQKRLRRYERSNARENPQSEAERRVNVVRHILKKEAAKNGDNVRSDH